MALVGGGGAGNVAGSNPAGVGTSFNTIGDHGYAYSGNIDIDNNVTTMLDFSTGNYYVIATYQPGYVQKTGDDYDFQLTFDDQAICGIHQEVLHQTPLTPIQLLIPPYTRVVVTGQNTTDTSTNGVFVNIVGRVYA